MIIDPKPYKSTHSVARDRPPLSAHFVRKLCNVPTIQVGKKRKSEESTWNKCFAVLDSYLLQLKNLTSAVDQVFVPKTE